MDKYPKSPNTGQQPSNKSTQYTRNSTTSTTSNLNHNPPPKSKLLTQLTMTIKQQQAIQQILMQALSPKPAISHQPHQPSYPPQQPPQSLRFEIPQQSYHSAYRTDLEELLKQSQEMISKEVKQEEKKKRELVRKNRVAIQLNDQDDRLREIFKRMDQGSEIGSVGGKEGLSDIDGLNGKKRKGSTISTSSKIKRQKRNKKPKQIYLSLPQQQTKNIKSDDEKSNFSQDFDESFGNAFTLDLKKLKHHIKHSKEKKGQTEEYEYWKWQNEKQWVRQGQKQNQLQNFQVDEYWQYKQQNSISIHSSQSQSSTPQPTPKPHIPPPQPTHNYLPPHILQRFEQAQILKQKQHSKKILELDQRYPKINPSSMYRHQFPILRFERSSVNKYLGCVGGGSDGDGTVGLRRVRCAVSFYVTGIGQVRVKWTILAIQTLLYVFIGQDWKQPIIVNPQRSPNQSTHKQIQCLSLSKKFTHLAVSLGNELIIYQIKKQTNQLTLLKNLSTSNDLSTEIFAITKLILYNDRENPVQLVYLDRGKVGPLNGGSTVGLVKLDQIMFLLRVGEKVVKHGLGDVVDVDVMCRGGKLGVFLAMASRRQLVVYRIQPNFQAISTINLHQPQQNIKQISVKWRHDPTSTTKPQLLISYSTKLYIYKLIEQQLTKSTSITSKTSILSTQQSYLQLHLLYKNHYPIRQMEIISNTHLMLHSNENVVVVAMPLIPSTDLSREMESQRGEGEGDGEGTGNGEGAGNGEGDGDFGGFQSAIVYVTSQEGITILYSSQDEIIYYSNKNPYIQLATLKTLQQHLQHQLLTEHQFRQAFTLLILIYKGINCSFKFSYTAQSLSQCIFSAVQCTINSLIVTMNDDIIGYRLGWICQLLIETHHQGMIWSLVYRRLMERQRERVRERDRAGEREGQRVGSSVISESDDGEVWESSIDDRDQRYDEESDYQRSSVIIQQTIYVPQTQKTRLKKAQTHNQHSQQYPLPSSSLASSFHSRHSHQPQPPPPPRSLEHILFDILQVFILKSYITSMPEQIFLDFVKYQSQKKEDMIVEKIILQNKIPYDGLSLLTLLQNQERNYLQMFLFSRAIICEEPDYYTPFIKVLNCFNKYSMKVMEYIKTEKYRMARSAIPQSSDQQQQPNIQSHQHRQNLTNYLNTGTLCLWYLTKCFKFERIPSGLMTLNEKQLIVTSLCVQMLSSTITLKLFAFNSKLFLESYLLMFVGGEIGNFMEEANQVLVGMYKKFYANQYQSIMSMGVTGNAGIGNKVDDNGEVFDKSFKELAILHLQLTIPNLKQKSQSKQFDLQGNINLHPNQIQTFQSKLQTCPNKLLWTQFQALCFYYNQTQIPYPFQTIVDILLTLFQSNLNTYNLYLPPRTRTRPTIEQLQLALIDYIKPVLEVQLARGNRFYMNKLIGFHDRHALYYLYRIDRNYRQALEYYMSVKDKGKVMGFVMELIRDVRAVGGENAEEISVEDRVYKERKLEEIKQFITKNIGEFFNINQVQALNLFYQIGYTTQQLYQIIEQTMSNKLYFLTSVLKKFQHEDFHMKQKLQLEHLAQVCMLKDKQMLKYLDQFYYPLDQAIVVCEQKGNLLAKAIFEERCGRVSQAFLSYERILRGIIQANGVNSGYKTQSEKKIKKDVHKYTEECLRLCKQCAYDPNSAPQNNFWLRIITFINGFIKSNSQHKIFLKVQFQRVLQHILIQMFKFLPTTLLIDFFITKSHKLELSLTKQFSIFQKLFTMVKFDIIFVWECLSISKIDIHDTRKELTVKRKTGLISSGACDFCKKVLIEQNRCNIYGCKHSFHRLCHQDMYKCLTCYYQSDNSIFQTNIFGAEMQKLGNNPQLQTRSVYNITANLKFQKKQSPTQPQSQPQSQPKLQDLNIIIEPLQIARKQSNKKKLKLFDYNAEQYDNGFYGNIDEYEQQRQGQGQGNREGRRVWESGGILETQGEDYVEYLRELGVEIKKEQPEPVENVVEDDGNQKVYQNDV